LATIGVHRHEETRMQPPYSHETIQCSASQALGGSKLDPPPAPTPREEQMPPSIPGPIRAWL